MRIGIVGGGQLGLMLGEAARELGMHCTFVDPGDSPPARPIGEHIRAPFDDQAALQALASKSDVITYEFENVPVDALAALDDPTPLYPPPLALQTAQDRLHEKDQFVALDIPVADYRTIDCLADLEAAAAALSLPLVLKTRRFGYDGKGQFVVRTPADIPVAWNELGSQPLIAEAWVPFDYEVSIIGARNTNGDIVTWPLSRNVHREGILRVAEASDGHGDLHSRASAYVHRLLSHLDYVGVLTLELFVAGDQLLANEFAPRVHNSGHWTIEGSETSQFTNHVLAITGRPLESTTTISYPGMVNLIGEIPEAARSLDDSRLYLHDYGKAPREGRKLGHITCVAQSEQDREELLSRLDEM